jgi:TRAP-type uncharacterized transport system substrate-binding protein
MKHTKLTVGALVTAAFMAPAAQAQEYITIGTGGVTGVYYPTGGAICRLVNKSRKEHGFKCAVESTGGSVYNINTIREGELQFGVAQSDWQHHAYHGTSKFSENGPFEGLRAVFSVHPEPFTVVARADAGITTFDDLKGKRVNIATELKAAEQSAALCDNQIDAMVYTVGHPSGSIQEATTACDSVLVTVDGDAVTKLVEDNAFYRTATIPGGMYRGSDADVQTFGVGATFVSSTDVPDEAVYAVVKSVFENFDAFRKLHPAFANLKPEEMIADGLSAPLHDGAAKYYREKGWIE